MDNLKTFLNEGIWTTKTTAWEIVIHKNETPIKNERVKDSDIVSIRVHRNRVFFGDEKVKIQWELPNQNFEPRMF